MKYFTVCNNPPNPEEMSVILEVYKNYISNKTETTDYIHNFDRAIKYIGDITDVYITDLPIVDISKTLRCEYIFNNKTKILCEKHFPEEIQFNPIEILHYETEKFWIGMLPEYDALANEDIYSEDICRSFPTFIIDPKKVKTNIWREPQYFPQIYCSAKFKHMCEIHKISGIDFREVETSG